MKWRILMAGVVVVLSVSSALAGMTEYPWLVGVNFSGAEIKPSRIPGIINKDYHYPNRRDLKHFLDSGFTAFRLPFRWERLQRNLGWELEARELGLIDDTVTYITDSGAYAILDPHNYARYFGKDIGSAQVPVSAFATFWAKLADHYKNNPRVVFGLMNEPHRIHADQWRIAAEAAVNAIRATGARNLILVPGTYWSGAHSWTKNRGSISNAAAFQDLRDPADNIAFEVHQYFDADYSGTSNECQSETVGQEALEKFTQWLRDNKQRGFLGEFGAANNPVCLAALDLSLQYVSENSDVWMGWTYWAAGAWWGDYMFSVHPSPDGDNPQMEVLLKYRGRP